MSAPVRVLLVRHGQSTWNADGRWQGWADPPLSDVGAEQARSAVHHLPPVAAVWSSDLARAHRTAVLLAEGAGLGPVRVLRGLRERGVGDFTGLTRAQIEERFPGLLASIPPGRPLEPPGGEPFTSLVARAVAALARIAAATGTGDVVAVSHGGVVRALERHLDAYPDVLANLAGRWFGVHPDGRLELGERLSLVDPDEAPVTVPRQL